MADNDVFRAVDAAAPQGLAAVARDCIELLPTNRPTAAQVLQRLLSTHQPPPPPPPEVQRECMVCMDAPINTRFRPCYHAVVCEEAGVAPQKRKSRMSRVQGTFYELRLWRVQRDLCPARALGGVEQFSLVLQNKKLDMRLTPGAASRPLDYDERSRERRSRPNARPAPAHVHRRPECYLFIYLFIYFIYLRKPPGSLLTPSQIRKTARAAHGPARESARSEMP